MLIVVTTFLASYVFVFLKAFQQRNVAFSNMVAIMPVSIAMAIVEVYIIATVATRGYSVPVVLAVGFGAGLGCICAVIIHKRVFKKNGGIK